jgi:hypothetical protein
MRPARRSASLHPCAPRPARGRRASASQRKPFIDTSFQIGKYLVSPLIKLLPGGRYAASVSIRSGRGSATHDRVLRLLPLFDTPAAAVRYAIDQGLAWLGESRPQPPAHA